MYKLNEYKWQQVSMWDSSPKNCIEKYYRSKDGEHIFHFYLIQYTEVSADGKSCKYTVVTDIENVPESILNSNGTGYNLKNF